MTQDQSTPQITTSDILDPARMQALAASLALTDDSVQPFWHQLYFWDAQKPDALGRDGHPKTGGIIPDMDLTRRMWAGGRLEFHAPPELGLKAIKTSSLLKADRKQGRTGPLGLVSLLHVITQNEKTLVREEQDLIYRAADAPSSEPPQAPNDETISQDHVFTPTELFRYSALTFNGHRIHYDKEYATRIEGYGGLVVHGPLLAQYLMVMAQQHIGRLSRFNFRATAPLLDGENAVFCAKPSGTGLTLWVRGPGGKQCLIAEATA